MNVVVLFLSPNISGRSKKRSENNKVLLRMEIHFIFVEYHEDDKSVHSGSPPKRALKWTETRHRSPFEMLRRLSAVFDGEFWVFLCNLFHLVLWRRSKTSCACKFILRSSAEFNFTKHKFGIYESVKCFFCYRLLSFHKSKLALRHEIHPLHDSVERLGVKPTTHGIYMSFWCSLLCATTNTEKNDIRVL